MFNFSKHIKHTEQRHQLLLCFKKKTILKHNLLENWKGIDSEHKLTESSTLQRRNDWKVIF